VKSKKASNVKKGRSVVDNGKEREVAVAEPDRDSDYFEILVPSSSAKCVGAVYRRPLLCCVKVKKDLPSRALVTATLTVGDNLIVAEPPVWQEEKVDEDLTQPEQGQSGNGEETEKRLWFHFRQRLPREAKPPKGTICVYLNGKKEISRTVKWKPQTQQYAPGITITSPTNPVPRMLFLAGGGYEPNDGTVTAFVTDANSTPPSIEGAVFTDGNGTWSASFSVPAGWGTNNEAEVVAHCDDGNEVKEAIKKIEFSS